MRFFADAHYQFIEKRRTAYAVSAALVLVGIAAALFFQFSAGSWLNYGVDFTGGTLVQVRFEESTSVADVRAVVPDAEITRFGGENEFLIRVQQFAEEGTNVSDAIDARLTQAFEGRDYEVVRTEAVGPKIGEELQQKAAIAILLSFGLTLLYLAFRFEWRFGVAAIIATLHDILFTLGFLALFRIEVSLPTVAAVLTIVGYSLNDTIVVFDRVRENLAKVGRRADWAEILDRSINETLPRTIMTSGTTIAVLLSLFLLGGAIIRDFALILMFGILVGTYSSVFVASPALLEIERRWKSEPRKPSPRTRTARAGAGV